MKITSETVKAKGYKEWVAATYMTENWQREKCAEWVVSLIKKGVLKMEVCNECGCSVEAGSGKFVNRVPDFNDAETRREMGKPFPEGGYICAECDARISEKQS